MRIVRYIFFAFALIMGLFLLIVLRQPAEVLTRELAFEYSKQLYEYGSVRFVHGVAAKSALETSTAALFDSVASGTPLTKDQSCRYRQFYWTLVQQRSWQFALLDPNTEFVDGYGQEFDNNCAEKGIPGLHDLHDHSAGGNLDDILRLTSDIRGGSNFIASILKINEINKDLLDILVHFAPSVHSIGVADPAFDVIGDTPLLKRYQSMQTFFKRAQFSDVNGCGYWANIDFALRDYVEIVLMVQNDISENSTALQRKIAGGWLALQTIAPRVDLAKPMRKRLEVLKMNQSLQADCTQNG